MSLLFKQRSSSTGPSRLNKLILSPWVTWKQYIQGARGRRREGGGCRKGIDSLAQYVRLKSLYSELLLDSIHLPLSLNSGFLKWAYRTMQNHNQRLESLWLVHSPTYLLTPTYFQFFFSACACGSPRDSHPHTWKKEILFISIIAYRDSYSLTS